MECRPLKDVVKLMASNWYSAQIMLYRSQRKPPPGSGKEAISSEEYLTKVAKLMNLPVLRERSVVWLHEAVNHLLKPDPQDVNQRNVIKKVTRDNYRFEITIDSIDSSEL
jgi:hypothetical protein